jgi:hypothetical protein
MIKSLVAFATFALLAAAVVALPGFAPQATAREPAALAKADRLHVEPFARDCSQQVWPDFATSCLHNAVSSAMVREARLVTVRHESNRSVGTP